MLRNPSIHPDDLEACRLLAIPARFPAGATVAGAGHGPVVVRVKRGHVRAQDGTEYGPGDIVEHGSPVGVFDNVESLRAVDDTEVRIITGAGVAALRSRFPHQELDALMALLGPRVTQPPTQLGGR